MTNFIETYKKRPLFNQTVREIRNMPIDVALDLGIHQRDAEILAARAVYGR